MKYDQGILEKIKEMQLFAKKTGLESVVADLEHVLDSYAEDLLSLDDLQDGSSTHPLSKSSTQTFNA